MQQNATTTKINNNLNQYGFKNKIVLIDCGSAPGNLVSFLNENRAMQLVI